MANADIRQLEMDGSVFYPQTDINGLVNNGSYAIDDEPTPGSENLVRSGGVASHIVYDISEAHNGTTYADLAAALGTNGANVPESIRHGGMTVSFVSNSDNKYVQYRLASPNWSTDIHDWTSEDPYFIDKVMQEVNEAIEANTPIVVEGNVTNAPDEEDLTSVNVGGTDVLKFKDKTYTPLTYSGMGRKILRKNIVDGVNTLTQDMFYKGEAGSRVPNTNTIYVIRYDFDLGNQDISSITITTENSFTVRNITYYYKSITVPAGKCIRLLDTDNLVFYNNVTTVDQQKIYSKISFIAYENMTVYIASKTAGTYSNAYVIENFVSVPDNSILYFDGGSISNGTITGNKVIMNWDVDYYIFKDVTPENFEFPYFNPKWFGAKADYNEETKTGTDDSGIFSLLSKLTEFYYNGVEIFINGKYFIGSTVDVKSDLNLRGTHCISRDLGSSLPAQIGNSTSPSLIAVGSCTAFHIIGKRNFQYASLSIHNIKAVGVRNDPNSIFLYCTTSGFPSRNWVIEECEFKEFNKVISLYGGDTMLSVLSITKCHIYYNTQFLHVAIEPGHRSTDTLGETTIADSTIEHNGTNAIYIEGLMGALRIQNNILEGQINPIYIQAGSHSSVEITNNGWEVTYCMAEIHGDTRVKMHGNFTEGGSREYVYFDGCIIDEFDTKLFKDNFTNKFKHCTINCIPIGFKLCWLVNYNYFSVFKEENNCYVKGDKGWNVLDSLIDNHIPAVKIDKTSRPQMRQTFIEGNSYYYSFYSDTFVQFSVSGVSTGSYDCYGKICVVRVKGIDPVGTTNTRRPTFATTSRGKYLATGLKELTNDSDLLNLSVPTIYKDFIWNKNLLLFDKPNGLHVYDETYKRDFSWNNNKWLDNHLYTANKIKGNTPERPVGRIIPASYTKPTLEGNLLPTDAKNMYVGLTFNLKQQDGDNAPGFYIITAIANNGTPTWSPENTVAGKTVSGDFYRYGYTSQRPSAQFVYNNLYIGFDFYTLDYTWSYYVSDFGIRRINSATLYDNTSTYSVGDFCEYNGVIFVCKRAIITPEDFNTYNWNVATETQITDNNLYYDEYYVEWKPRVYFNDILTASDSGFEYFDTDLGKYIYASNINEATGVITWVDATSTPV